MSAKNESIEGNVFSVSFEDAMVWTRKWQMKINPATGAPYPKSYRFRKEDFLEILSEDNVSFIRIYPCVEDGGEVSLLAVGTDANDVDLINEDTEPSGIYNFATPCPNTCGLSPLNHSAEE